MADLDDCLVCGHSERRPLYPVRDFEYGVPWDSQLLLCEGCGLVSHDPPIRQSEIPTLYPDDYHAHRSGSEAGLYWKLRRGWSLLGLRTLLASVPEGGRLLEVGCGNGDFLRMVAEARPDLELHGVDIVDTGIDDIEGLTFHSGMLETVDIPVTFDLIYFDNLIEHVADPVVFLEKCRELSKPGGRIHGKTPDHLSVDRPLFGRYWAGYHYPRHTFVFDHHNIRLLLDRCGFQDVEVEGAYAYWSLSLRNLWMPGHGSKPRGVVHAGITIGMLPVDLAINRLRCHGAMTFTARTPEAAR